MLTEAPKTIVRTFHVVHASIEGVAATVADFAGERAADNYAAHLARTLDKFEGLNWVIRVEKEKRAIKVWPRGDMPAKRPPTIPVRTSKRHRKT